MATQQSGLVSGNKQNQAGGQTGSSRSLFPLSYSVFQTERFAEYVPFTVMEGVSGDKLPLHSNHELQTYTLKSPILQSLAKKKDYFAVPMQAILPLNWEKFYTNPNIGQDVPVDCGLGLDDFWIRMRSLFNTAFSTLQSTLGTPSTDEQAIQDTLRFLLFFEQIYSTGSLMETLGISGHNWFRMDKADTAISGLYHSVTFDDFFDSVLGAISSEIAASESIDFTIGTDTYQIVSQPLDVARSYKQQITLREALELMRDDLSFTITSVTSSVLVSNLDTLVGDFYPQLPQTDAPLNLGRLWAYQICVAHFYSNDHVDFIYSADLFRQYIQGLVSSTFLVTDGKLVDEFTVNGLTYQYDSLSARYLDVVITDLESGFFQAELTDYAYFTALFSFKRSLRFMDFFTGARAFPLAVGDHEVTIGTNTAGRLDIIALSQASMMTKFLQAVNRSGRKFSAYMQELFHRTPAYDYHNPMFLAHSSDLVGAPETENTGAGQLDTGRSIAVTSRFKATANRFAFEFTPDRDCIVIGITYYDIPRVYTRATERQNFVLDRFDMFNPYLQFTGDQPISEAEIGTDTPLVSSPFAYTNKDMQYKQRFNQASGGFCVPSTGLDNWIFEADSLRRKFAHHISPSFIRSFNSEIDRFYQRLTGFSLGTYFHFIVRYDNRMNASRPMAYNPTINV